MTFDRRQALALMASGATAMLAPPAWGQAAPRLAQLSEGVDLNVPGSAGASYTAVTPLPDGGFLWGWSNFDGTYLRAFDGALRPDGRHRAIGGRELLSKPIGMVAFIDGSALYFYIGGTGGEDSDRVFAVPVSKRGEQGDPTPLSAKGDEPRELFAARLAEDTAIVAWRSSESKPIDVRWRVVSKDGTSLGEIRMLNRPDGVAYQRPTSLAVLKDGGAVIGYYPSPENDGLGRPHIQRIGRGGKTIGAPMRLRARFGHSALTGLRYGGFAAAWLGLTGLSLAISKPGGELGREIAVETGLKRIAGIAIAPAPYGGAVVIVGGATRRRSMLIALLVDELGRQLREPTTLRSEDTQGNFEAYFLPQQARTLVNGDVFVAWSDASESQARPSKGAILRIV